VLRPTPTVEDYLGVIYALDRDGETVIEAKLASWLEVSAPTVTATTKRMIRDGWVTMSKSKEMLLTPLGRNAAKSLVRRHMLTESLLARILGVPWSEVHQEADGMEHALSDETAERLDAFLERPATCPHGNPLPDHEKLLEQLVPLTRAEADRSWTVARIDEGVEGNHDLMAYLECHRLMPGAAITIEEVMPFNQTISVQVNRETVVLGTTVATHIYVCESTRQSS
jgi:DtxR family Mn-dependent transcriptional regulator